MIYLCTHRDLFRDGKRSQCTVVDGELWDVYEDGYCVRGCDMTIYWNEKKGRYMYISK